MMVDGIKVKHTAYDDAFRTLEAECDDALILFINAMFHEDFDNTAKIVRLRNEHFVEEKGKTDAEGTGICVFPDWLSGNLSLRLFPGSAGEAAAGAGFLSSQCDSPFSGQFCVPDQSQRACLLRNGASGPAGVFYRPDLSHSLPGCGGADIFCILKDRKTHSEAADPGDGGCSGLFWRGGYAASFLRRTVKQKSYLQIPGISLK